MGLEKVIQEIGTQAEQEKKTILKKAEDQAADLLKEAKGKATLVKKEAAEKTKAMTQELKNRRLSKYRLEQHKEQMNVKSKVFEEIFSTALAQTKKMSDVDKKSVLKKLLSKALTELPDAKYFYANKTDSKIIEKLNSKLKFAGAIDTVCGLVVENNDQTIKVNYTFEVLFEKVKEDALHEVSNNLF